MKLSLISLAAAGIASVAAAPTQLVKRTETVDGSSNDGRIGAAYTNYLYEPKPNADILIRGGGFTNRLEDFNVTISWGPEVGFLSLAAAGTLADPSHLPTAVFGRYCSLPYIHQQGYLWTARSRFCSFGSGLPQPELDQRLVLAVRYPPSACYLPHLCYCATAD